MEIEIELDEIEHYISSHSQASNKDYAFYVVLPEDKYQILLDLFKKKKFRSPEKYPWCHLKLMTETYVRKFDDRDNIKAQDFISKALGVDSISYWNKINSIIEQLSLKRINSRNEERGNYKMNLTAHSGVPVSFFDEIFSLIKESYDYCGKKKELAIKQLISNNFLKNLNVLLSFKDVFSDKERQELLIKWFIDLIWLSENFNLNEIKDRNNIFLENKIPPHLLDEYLKYNSKILDHPIKEDKVLKNRYEKSILKFNENEGYPEYHMSLKEVISEKFKMKTNSNDPISRQWIKSKESSIKHRSNIIIFPIKPEELNLEISIYSSTYYSEKVFSTNDKETKCLLFDEKNKVIMSNIDEIVINKYITVLTKEPCKEIEDLEEFTRLYDLSEDWIDWHHYQLEENYFIEDLNVKLPEPYNLITFKGKNFLNKIRGKWISENKLFTKYSLEYFGGYDIPEFIIEFENLDTKPNIEVIAKFFKNDGTYIQDSTGNLLFEGNQVIWRSLKEIKDLCKYEIVLFIFLNYSVEPLDLDFKCIWYPTLNLEIEPKNLILPNEKCCLKITGENITLNNSKNELDFDIISENDSIICYFREKPYLSKPNIFINFGNDVIELNISLPYLSIFITTTDSPDKVKLTWTNDNYFLHNFLKAIYFNDVNARIRFYYSGDSDEKICLLNEEDEIIKRIEFSFPEVIYSSIRIGEIYKKNIFLKYDKNNLKLELTKKEKINIWSFNKINSIIKQKNIYKEKYIPDVIKNG